jgi:hypothetical protein
MKNLVLFILGLTLLLFASCSNDDSEIGLLSEDEVELELISFDQLNATLVSNELEPIEPIVPDHIISLLKENGVELITHDLRNIPSTERTYKCSNFELHNAGDWNNNNTFSVQDLVIAQQFLLTQGPGAYAGINQSAFEFGQFSSIILGPGIQHNFLNFADFSLAELVLLGVITCP